MKPEVDEAFFTQAAKDIFVRMQQAWDDKNLEEMQSFCSPDVVNHIQQMMPVQQLKISTTRLMKSGFSSNSPSLMTPHGIWLAFNKHSNQSLVAMYKKHIIIIAILFASTLTSCVKTHICCKPPDLEPEIQILVDIIADVYRLSAWDIYAGMPLYDTAQGTELAMDFRIIAVRHHYERMMGCQWNDDRFMEARTVGDLENLVIESCIPESRKEAFRPNQD